MTLPLSTSSSDSEDQWNNQNLRSKKVLNQLEQDWDKLMLIADQIKVVTDKESLTIKRYIF